MNFLEAMKELVEGRCEGIRIKDSGEAFIKIEAGPGGRLVWSDDGASLDMLRAEAYLRDDWEIVNPKPQEITLWVNVYPENKYFAYDSKETAFRHLGLNGKTVKMTGVVEP